MCLYQFFHIPTLHPLPKDTEGHCNRCLLGLGVIFHSSVVPHFRVAHQPPVSKNKFQVICILLQSLDHVLMLTYVYPDVHSQATLMPSQHFNISARYLLLNASELRELIVQMLRK